MCSEKARFFLSIYLILRDCPICCVQSRTFFLSPVTISMPIANASVVTDQYAKLYGYLIEHVFHVGPICNSCFPQVPFLVPAGGFI